MPITAAAGDHHRIGDHHLPEPVPGNRTVPGSPLPPEHRHLHLPHTQGAIRRGNPMWTTANTNRRRHPPLGNGLFQAFLARARRLGACPGRAVRAGGYRPSTSLPSTRRETNGSAPSLRSMWMRVTWVIAAASELSNAARAWVAQRLTEPCS
jgi:hypothetical protein